MTNYGKIHSYDAAKGSGMITPEKGGDALPFAKADLQQQAEVPMVDQRYGYETKQVDGGKSCATHLQMEQAGSDKNSGSMQQGESDNRSNQQSQSENRSGQQGESKSGQNNQSQNDQGQSGRGSDHQG